MFKVPPTFEDALLMCMRCYSNKLEISPSSLCIGEIALLIIQCFRFINDYSLT
jgi:hypothetical protein